jgi:hypothetical protein
LLKKSIMKTRIFSLTMGMCIVVLTSAQSHIKASREDSKPQPVLWKDPGNIAARDLFWGSGSAAAAPQPPFTFVKEDTGGTKPKVHVTDARGVTWSVKFAGDSPSQNEVHAEVAASRLTWALGYLVEENYYVPEGKIDQISNLTKATAHIAPDGTFRTARFEKRPAHIVRTGKAWTFDRNPFVGTKELSGLKILTTLIGNWDARASNSEVLQMTLPGGGVEDWYVLTDLGSTFGQMGLPTSLSKHNRWSVDDYRDQKLVDFAKRDLLRLHYRGGASIQDVPIGHGRWFADRAAQLTPDQVKLAFKAAGATDGEVEGFSAAFLGKIAELQGALSNVE